MSLMLASDFEESKLRFPLGAQPKIDGVRGANLTGKLLARSLKEIRNRHTFRFFSRSYFAGFDGELAAEHECHPDLCRLTTSATSSIEGQPFVLWWLFDYVTVDTQNLPYYERYKALANRLAELTADPIYQPYAGHLRIMPMVMCNSLEQLLAYEEECLEAGYEGVCVRDLKGMHKKGRSTVREGGLLRIKRFIEDEAIVTGIIEGERNENDAQINELGKTFRSTHQENMIPNGMVGNIQAVACKDVFDGKKQVIGKGQLLTISPGNMPHDQRKMYFENRHLLVGKTIKYKFFPKGIKEKPRFPTFVTIRDSTDM